MATAVGDVNITPGSAVGRLGQDAAAAEAAASRDTGDKSTEKPTEKPAETTSEKPAEKPAEKPVEKPAEQTPEQKAEAIAAAEKAVTEAKTPEEKAVAEAKLAELKGEKKDEKPKGAPDKYEAFKVPEGVKINDAELAEFTPIAKDLNLTQDQAQQLIDLEVKRAAARAEGAMTQWNAHMDATLATAKADKEIGGQNWDQSLVHAKAFMTAFGTPELQAYLNTAEAGSHVEIIRAFAKAGKVVSEDGFVLGGTGATAAQKTLAQRMYPSMKN